MDKIEVKNLVKVYGNNLEPALDDVSFQVKDGEFLSIMGKSGCGKSTLLRLLGAIDRPTEGEVYIDEIELSDIKGDDLAKLRQEKMGFIFQDFLLVDSLTVEENVILPLFLKGVSFEEAEKKLKKILENLDIRYISNSYPKEISGGERQRTAIARAVIHEPEIIFADEPTGNLDVENSKRIIEYMEEMNTSGQTILMVTHDPTMASYSDRVIFLRDGKITRELSKENMDRGEYLKKIIEKVGY